jgi:endonuclease I
MISYNKALSPRLFFLVTLIFVSSLSAFGQDEPPSELSGKELRTWLKSNWYDDYHWVQTSERFKNPVYMDPYQDARREMYNYFDNKENKVVGVYSGYSVAWDFGGTGSNPQPINCEHTVPQSFFRPGGQDNSSEPMRSDLHHLFPTLGKWNSVRSNYPFDDIDDEKTTKWMYLDTDQATPPTSDKDLYSEFSDADGYNRFEPREDHKGDVARAVLYFYTMYEDNPEVFRSIAGLGDIKTFIAWNILDPVTDAELTRNDSIAFYQGNSNPYVKHPDIAERAWDDLINVEIPLDVPLQKTTLVVYPNPVSNSLYLKYSAIDHFTQVKIINTSGQMVYFNSSWKNSESIDVSSFNTGIYTLLLSNPTAHKAIRLIKN